MHIGVFAIGKMRNRECAGLCALYRRRLERWCRLREWECPHERFTCGGAASAAGRLLAALEPYDRLVLLMVEGRAMDSTAFASELGSWRDAGGSAAFLIGGPDGIPAPVLRGVDERFPRGRRMELSFSRMTFPHELFRVMLYEQLYRAFSILHGAPYHK